MALISSLGDLLITLNKRLDTAAAAIVHKMINRRRPRVFRPVSPFKKGSIEVVAMLEGTGLHQIKIIIFEQLAVRSYLAFLLGRSKTKSPP